VVDADDVGMVEGRRRPRLALEAFEHAFVSGRLAVQDLDGDETLELELLAQEDGAHAALADGSDHLVLAAEQEEALVTAGEQLFGLISAEQAVLGEAPGGRSRITGKVGRSFQVVAEMLVVEELAVTQ